MSQASGDAMARNDEGTGVAGGAVADGAGRDRRDAILQAAAEVIGERGLSETRLSDITARAGVSPPLAVYYFTSKDRLLAEALAYADLRFYDETMQELAALPTARERLVGLIERSCPLLLDPGGYDQWTLWIETWTRALRDPDVEAQRHALDQRWRDTIAQIVREGRRDLEFAPVDVDEFVLRLAAIIDGLMIQVLLGDRTIGPERMRDVVVGMTARELGFEAPAFRAPA
jgi:AcrR family transcriptional regulator